MGFCRRCGDIVSGPRCKCGGTAVAPSVNFNPTTFDRQDSDMWSRTYVTRERSSTVPSTSKVQSSPSKEAPIPVRKFPRPISAFPPETPIGSRVSSHIHSTIAHRPSSPLKSISNAEISENPPSPAADILADPHTSTLSKAYGSVLQPKETLSTFTCFLCFAPFPPDATIYPDPANPKTSTRFLCKPCFTTNGGTKGDCFSCSRPVLMLSSEGGFVENAGRVWHWRCFRCDGCFKDIADSPMVDLLGRPSCEECFDSCLKRPSRDSPASRRFYGTPDKSESRSNPGGLKGASREGSPAIVELHQRFGIKSREGSPLIDRAGPRNGNDSPASNNHNRRLSNGARTAVSPNPRASLAEDVFFSGGDGSPRGRYEKFRVSQMTSPRTCNPSPRLGENGDPGTDHAILRRSYTSSSSMRSLSPATSISRDSASVTPSTPDLTDFSDSLTNSSAPSTPPSVSPNNCLDGDGILSQSTPTKTPTGSSQNNICQALTMGSPSTPCAKCSKPLFRRQGRGRFVTVPEESAKSLPPKSYHVDCFRCVVCDEPFEETKNGQAVFVRSSTGCCHIGCATPERIVIRPLKTKLSSSSISSTLNNQNQPPKTAPPTTTSFQRFLGGGTTCPGCHVSVSPMERGVVPGPQGSRWHSSCLVCGGKGMSGSNRRDPNMPGCGKRLDSAAKTDGEGGVWCSECLLLIPGAPRSRQGSPIRPLTPSHTGGIFGRFPQSFGRRNEGVAPQLTGTTTIARQFTGMSALTTQLTGSGLSPTRQLARSPSPTKTRAPVGRLFPRPKSVIGYRGKSVDEGRGMFLVRQMTGGGQGLGL